MEVAKEDVEELLKTVNKYKTIREGWSDFRQAKAKDPTIDQHSYGCGFEAGIYYAIAMLCGTEWVDTPLNTEE